MISLHVSQVHLINRGESGACQNMLTIIYTFVSHVEVCCDLQIFTVISYKNRCFFSKKLNENKPISGSVFLWLATTCCVDNKSVASCQQTCCNLIVEIC